MLQAGYRAPSLQRTSYLRILLICCAGLFIIVECCITHFLCTMHIFNIRASSSPPRLPLCQILFMLCPPIAELACGEKLDIQALTHLVTHFKSLSHSSSLFDMPGTEAYHFGTCHKRSCCKTTNYMMSGMFYPQCY